MTTLVGGRLEAHAGATAVTVRDGLITAVGGEIDEDVVDVSGLSMSPGLIDLQINGAYGDDFTSDPASMWRVGARLPEQGVTAFLPTIITSTPEAIEAAIGALAGRPAAYRGAEPLGLHLEGPMLAAQRSGVHDGSLIRLPSATLIEGWTSERGVLLVTLAPELPGAEAAVKTLLEAGVTVSAGHSAADYDQAMEGFRWGITAVTHLFNAMEPFHHRAPALIGATLETSDVTAGLIVDGIHAHPAAVRTAWNVLGPHRLALVTDAMAAAGLGDGSYEIGSISVDVADGRCTESSGRLAGSALTLDLAVRNLIEYTGCLPAEAAAAASSVPARVLGLPDRGRVLVGARADLTLFDQSMQVAATIVAGDIVWQS